MNKIFSIFLDVLIGIIVIVILFVLYSLIQTKMLHKDCANFFGYTILQVSTGSMRDTLQEKDIIIVKILNKTQIENLNENDIILYKQDNALIVHRIVRIENSTIITKGDANNTEDKPIQKDIVIGKMVKVISKVGIWQKVFTTPKVYVSIIITISLFGITFLYDKGDGKRNAKEKN